MVLWYFPAETVSPDALSALTERFSEPYFRAFTIVIFVRGTQHPCNVNGCQIQPLQPDMDSTLLEALGADFAYSYTISQWIHAQAERMTPPDILLFPDGIVSYYPLLYRYLGDSLLQNSLILLEQSCEKEEADDAVPSFLLPHWWIEQQTRFCRNAADCVLTYASCSTSEHQICARDLAQFSQTKFSHRTVPQNFPFLTVRPQDPVADVTCEQGLLSIIIPYYNLGASLAKTLESVFAVDYPNYEVIIIDDGSTERDSVSILQKMELLYPNLKVIRQENHGLSYVRNRGCEIAQGEYITFLDADDLIAPDFYRRAIALLKQYLNAAYISSWLQYFGALNGYKAYFSSCLPMLLLDNMQCAGCVCRRAVMLTYGKNSLDMNRGMEDHECWINLAEHGYFGINIPEPLYFYQISEKSMSASFSRESNHYRHMELFSILEKKHPALYREYSTEMYNLLMANGPSFLWHGPSLSHPPIGHIVPSDDFWQKELDLARADAENYKNSLSYRLGHLLLSPFRRLLQIRAKSKVK